MLTVASLIRNLRLDELRQECERFLPAEVASFGGNDFRDSLLHDVHLGSDQTPSSRDRHLHLARQVRVIESVGVSNALVGDQFEVLSAERWLLPVLKFVNDIL